MTTLAPTMTALAQHPILPFTKRYEFARAYSLSADFKQQIQVFMRAEFGPTLPDDWNWAWTVGKGDGPYVGNFSARVKSWLWKANQIKATKDVVAKLARLGELTKRLYPTNELTYYFDLTQKIDWYAGDYGEENSCFLDGRSPIATKMLVWGGGGALRRYSVNLDGDWVPMGRSWVTLCKYGFIVSNVREAGGAHIYDYAAALTAWLGMGAYGEIPAGRVFNHTTKDPLDRRPNGYPNSFYTEVNGGWLVAFDDDALKQAQAAPEILLHLPYSETEPPYRWTPPNYDGEWEEEELEGEDV